MIRKAVIPAGGLGTRLLPATKQQPKEMLPVFCWDSNKQLCLKPLIQVVFEKLYDNNFEEFCFIVGRGKRSIEDHFTLDNSFVEYLTKTNKLTAVCELNRFYEKVRTSKIVFVNQPEPKGFGDALCYAETFTGKEPFVVHAGDDLILSKNNGYFKTLVEIFEKNQADAVFCVETVEDPRRYGVIQGKKIGKKLYKVTGIDEKPIHPRSNIAIVALYVFSKTIYHGIRSARDSAKGEIELTAGIKQLIEEGCRVYAVELSRDEKRVDIGTPHSYWDALNSTFNTKPED
jgi:UTP--glucose-1-phosphate uridylyltransferase